MLTFLIVNRFENTAYEFETCFTALITAQSISILSQ